MKIHALIAATTVALAGCAQQFPVSPLSAEETAFEQSLRSEDGAEAKLALAQMYFMHNRIDEADALLDVVVQAEPGNAQALAWQGANDCKRAGRRGPWLMGFDKLYLVKQCLDQIEGALKKAPDDFVVQMVQMNTAAEVDMFGALERAQGTVARVEAGLDRAGLPHDAQAQFLVTAAKVARKSGQTAQAAAYLERAVKLESSITTRTDIESERARLAKG